jgi:hypothetical protein
VDLAVTLPCSAEWRREPVGDIDEMFSLFCLM